MKKRQYRLTLTVFGKDHVGDWTDLGDGKEFQADCLTLARNGCPFLVETQQVDI